MKAIICNYEFTAKDKYTRYFSSKENALNYFINNKKLDEVERFNFIKNDGVYSNLNNLLIKDEIFNQANYIIIIYDKEDGSIDYDKTRFYFISKMTQLSGPLYNLELDLDDFITNLIGNESVVKGKILKGHYNRWKKISKDGNQFLTYDFSGYSPFHNKQYDNFSKILTIKNKCYVHNSKYGIGEENIIENWLKEKVDYWLVIFSNRQLKGKNSEVEVEPNIYFNGMCIYYVPKFKNAGSRIEFILKYKKNPDDEEVLQRVVEIDGEIFLLNYITYNAPYIFNICYSSVMPFPSTFLQDFMYDAKIEGSTLIFERKNIINKDISNTFFPVKDIVDLGSDFSTAFFKYDGDAPYLKAQSTKLNQFFIESVLFEEDYVKNNSNTLSPVLVRDECLEFKITMYGGGDYFYPLSNLLYDNAGFDILPTFSIILGLSPSGISSYVNLGEPIGYYNKNTLDSDSALIELSTVSSPVVTTKFADYVANNKNFLMQSISTYLGMGKSGVASMAGSGSTAGAIASGVSSILDVANKGWQDIMQLDNIKNSPSSLVAGSIDYFLKKARSNHGLYVEIKQIEPIQKQILLENIKKFGYTINLVDSLENYIKKTFFGTNNKRFYYNYISMEVYTMECNLTNLEKDRLKEKLKDITFIYDRVESVTSLYNYQNFEEYLLNL